MMVVLLLLLMMMMTTTVLQVVGWVVRWLSGRIWDLHAKRSLSESMSTFLDLVEVPSCSDPHAMTQIDLPQEGPQSEQMTVRRNLGSSAPRDLVISLLSLCGANHVGASRWCLCWSALALAL